MVRSAAGPLPQDRAAFNPADAHYVGASADTGAPIPDGINVAYSNGPIAQQTTVAAVPNTLYELSVDVGDRLDLAGPGYTITLMEGANVLGSVDQTDFPLVNGEFVTATLTAINISGTGLLSINLDSAGAQTNFDNVRLQAKGLIPITNPSFELDVLADGTNTDGTLSGWTAPAGSGAFNPADAQYSGASADTGAPIPDGVNVAFSNGPIVQQTTVAAVPNTVYELSVDVGDRLDQPAPGYTITLLEGTNVLGSVDQTDFPLTDGGFVTATFTAINTSGTGPLSIKLESAGVQTNFDNVRLESTSLVINADDVGVGTNNNINISLDAGGNNVVVKVDGIKVLDLPKTVVPYITINGQTGDDTLTVDYANSDPIPAGGIDYDGGAGGSDTLIVGGGDFGTIEKTFTGVDSGNVDLDGSVITYTGLEPVLLNVGTAVDIIFNLPAGPNTDVVIGDDGFGTDPNGNTANTSAIDGSTFEFTEFTNPTNSLMVNLGNGGDTISMRAMDASFCAQRARRHS